MRELDAHLWIGSVDVFCFCFSFILCNSNNHLRHGGTAVRSFRVYGSGMHKMYDTEKKG